MKNHNSRPTLTLVGASIRAAAQSATRAGWNVVGFDLFGDSDCRAACDQFELISAGDRQAEPAGDCQADPTHGDTPRSRNMQPRCDAAPPVLVVGGLSQDVCSLPADLESLLSPGLSPGLDGAANANLRNPDFLGSLAGAVGMKFPLTLPTEVKTRQRLTAHTTSSGERWLWKDLSSSGGIHVRWFADCRGAEEPSATSRQNSGTQFYQQWIAGKRFGVSYISDGIETVMLGACRSLHTRKSPLPFVYGGSYGPVSLTQPQTETLRSLGELIVATTQMAGVFGVDVIIDALQNLWLLEINPRWTASSELIERDLIHRGVLGANESLIGSTCKMQFPVLAETLQSPSIAELKMRLLQNDQVSLPLLKKVVFARRSGIFNRETLTAAETDGFKCFDVPLDDAPITKGHPLCSLIGATSSLFQLGSAMRLRQLVRLAQDSIR
ncbi:ATP-grasp domain-containing protein [Novipirellula maiorica]|uniref:ATP-grasp domain-containing protein n=1 Tax=Novipirellula maiorica TaxID=1265734 RepID=UPI000347F2A4|nr:ATP-grasp domain-containing protein [Rhodopirellula maiorica]